MLFTHTTFIGIDPTAGQKPFVYAALDEDLRLLALGQGGMDEVLAFAAGQRRAYVAICAPRRPNLGLMAQEEYRRRLSPAPRPGRWLDLRLADYLLRQHNIPIPQTYADEQACPKWMQMGFTLFRRMEHLGYLPCTAGPAAEEGFRDDRRGASGKIEAPTKDEKRKNLADDGDDEGSDRDGILPTSRNQDETGGGLELARPAEGGVISLSADKAVTESDGAGEVQEGTVRISLEVYPHACFAVLLGLLPFPKHSLEGRIQRQLALFEHKVSVPDPMRMFEEITRHKLLRGVLPTEDLYTAEELDALAAAYTAWRAAKNPEQITLLGDPAEGQIVLPAAELKPRYENPSAVCQSTR